jgi:hypothetical protein
VVFMRIVARYSIGFMLLFFECARETSMRSNANYHRRGALGDIWKKIGIGFLCFIVSFGHVVNRNYLMLAQVIILLPPQLQTTTL